MPALASPTLVPLDDGRVLAVDDVGDPDGAPVLYLHGAPDSRLSRHPDDGLAARAGVRLLAVDRPGCGRSTGHPGRTLGSVADDLAAACAHLGVDRTGVLAWSAGAPFAVALAARHPRLVAAVGLAAPLVPVDAYATPEVAEAAGPGRALFAEMAAELPAEEVAAEVAPYLLPDPATTEAVAAHLREEGDERRAAELATVPGGFDHLVAATVEAVARGRDGLSQEVATQAGRPDVDLAAGTAPVTIWSGTADPVAPPAFGAWWAATAPGARHHVLEGATHVLHLPRWATLLAALVPGPAQ
ncbi:MAG TPA: alpha/beta hydrolase [Acidimicrobiales bacterium]|nr:alpha/beta hydrolase [Acidimicrobiales bacterium]